MTQICTFYKYDPKVWILSEYTQYKYLLSTYQAPVPKKKLTVKWRDMTTTIFSKKRKHSADSETNESDVDDDFVDEDSDLNDHPEDDDKDDADVTRSEPDVDTDECERPTEYFDSDTFDAAKTMNLKSADLIDILVEKDAVPAKPVATKPTAPRVVPPAKEKVLVEADWDM